MFKYGGFKLFLIKVFLGFILTATGLFCLISLSSYNPDDPGFGNLQSFGEITNFFGSLGAFASSLFLFLFGYFSYVVSSYFALLGLMLFFGFVTKNTLLKFFCLFCHQFYLIIFLLKFTLIIYIQG